MGESEGVLLVVPVLDLGILLLEELVSEVVLLFGSIAESKGLHMGVELLVKLGSSIVLGLMEAKDGGAFPEVLHFKRDFRYFYKFYSQAPL